MSSTLSSPTTTTTSTTSTAAQQYTYKGKVTFRSWPQLPHELVRHIATFYLFDVQISNYCPRVWDKRELWHSRMMYITLRDAVELEKIMQICPQWSLALESHLFWQQAVSLIDPLDLLAHHAIIQPPSQVHPSQASHASRVPQLQLLPTRISSYRHFRGISAYSCLVCRINSPASSMGLNSIARTHTTPYLGIIGLCSEHEKRTLQFCGLCLREGGLTETDFDSWIGGGGTGFGGLVNFTQAHQQALIVGCLENEDKTSFPGVHATCRSCRKEHLWNHASLNPNDVLALGASQGLNASNSPTVNTASGQRYTTITPAGSPSFEPVDWETRQAVDSFIEMAEGEIKDVLTIAREKYWLRKYTRLADMLSQAIAAQRFNTGAVSAAESRRPRLVTSNSGSATHRQSKSSIQSDVGGGGFIAEDFMTSDDEISFYSSDEASIPASRRQPTAISNSQGPRSIATDQVRKSPYSDVESEDLDDMERMYEEEEDEDEEISLSVRLHAGANGGITTTTTNTTSTATTALVTTATTETTLNARTRSTMPLEALVEYNRLLLDKASQSVRRVPQGTIAIDGDDESAGDDQAEVNVSAVDTDAHLAALDDEEEIEQDADEEDGDDEEEEEDPEILQAAEEHGVKELALGDWARTRIIDGFWISPADLWYGQVVPGVGIESVGAVHPVPWAREGEDSEEEAGEKEESVDGDIDAESDNDEIASRRSVKSDSRTTRTRLPSRRHRHRHPKVETMTAEMPPTYELCEQAYSAHLQQMRVVLLRPLQNVVRKIVMEYQEAVNWVFNQEREGVSRSGRRRQQPDDGDAEDEAVDVEEGFETKALLDPAIKAARMTLDEVITLLREEEGVWFDGVDWSEKRRNERMLEKEKRWRERERTRQVEQERRHHQPPTVNTGAANSNEPSGSELTPSSESPSNSSGPECSSYAETGSRPSSTSPVLSTSTLQTTPSPPPSVDHREKEKGTDKGDAPRLNASSGSGNGTPRASLSTKGRPRIDIDTKIDIDIDVNEEKESTKHEEKSETPARRSIWTRELEAGWKPAKVTIPLSPVLNPPKLLRPIPYVPASIAHLPHYSVEALSMVWREACTPLFHCRCKICERAAAKVNADAVTRAGGGATAVLATTNTNTATQVDNAVPTPVRAVDVDFVNQQQTEKQQQKEQQQHAYPPSAENQQQPHQGWVQVRLHNDSGGEQEELAVRRGEDRNVIAEEEEEEEELEGIDGRAIRYEEEEEEEEEEEDMEEVDVAAGDGDSVVESQYFEGKKYDPKIYEPISAACAPRKPTATAGSEMRTGMGSGMGMGVLRPKSNPNSDLAPSRSNKRSIDDVQRGGGGEGGDGDDGFYEESERDQVGESEDVEGSTTTATSVSSLSASLGYDSNRTRKRRIEGTPPKRAKRSREGADVGSDEEERGEKKSSEVNVTSTVSGGEGEGAMTPSRRKSNRAYGDRRHRHQQHRDHQSHQPDSISANNADSNENDALKAMPVPDGGNSRSRKRNSEELEDEEEGTGDRSTPSSLARQVDGDGSGDEAAGDLRRRSQSSHPYHPHHLPSEAPNTNHNQVLVPSPVGGNGNKRYKVASLIGSSSPTQTMAVTATGPTGDGHSVPRMGKTVWLTSGGNGEAKLTKVSTLQVGDTVVVTDEVPSREDR